MLSGVDSFISSELTTVKILFLIPSLSFQTFIVCYLFGNLHSSNFKCIISFNIINLLIDQTSTSHELL